MRLAPMLAVAALPLMPLKTASEAVDCARGKPVSASLGDGVILYSCSWEKTPGVFVRTGPLRLVRHGILILQLQTDTDGKLQGEYSVWDDTGVLIENGRYVDGLKHGEWRVTGSDGLARIIHFHAGVKLAP